MGKSYEPLWGGDEPVRLSSVLVRSKPPKLRLLDRSKPPVIFGIKTHIVDDVPQQHLGEQQAISTAPSGRGVLEATFPKMAFCHCLSMLLQQRWPNFL